MSESWPAGAGAVIVPIFPNVDPTNLISFSDRTPSVSTTAPPMMTASLARRPPPIATNDKTKNVAISAARIGMGPSSPDGWRTFALTVVPSSATSASATRRIATMTNPTSSSAARVPFPE